MGMGCILHQRSVGPGRDWHKRGLMLLAVIQSAMSTLLILVLLCVFPYVYMRQKLKGRSPLPPGPPGDPLIGHLRMVPPENQGTLFYEWGKIYGMSFTWMVNLFDMYQPAGVCKGMSSTFKSSESLLSSWIVCRPQSIFLKKEVPITVIDHDSLYTNCNSNYSCWNPAEC